MSATRRKRKLKVRKAAEVFPVSHFIREELDARGWTVQQLAIRMNWKGIALTQLAIEMQLACDSDPGVVLERWMASKLSDAFSVSEEFFLNLDKAWHEYCQLRDGKP